MTRFDARRAGSRRWRPRTPRQWRAAGRSSRHPWSGRHLSQVPRCQTAPERPLFLLWISVDTWITVPRCGEDVLVTEGAGSSSRLRPPSPRAAIRDPMRPSRKSGPVPLSTKFLRPFPPNSHLLELVGGFWDRIWQVRRSDALQFSREAVADFTVGKGAAEHDWPPCGALPAAFPASLPSRSPKNACPVEARHCICPRAA